MRLSRRNAACGIEDLPHRHGPQFGEQQRKNGWRCVEHYGEEKEGRNEDEDGNQR